MGSVAQAGELDQATGRPASRPGGLCATRPQAASPTYGGDPVTLDAQLEIAGNWSAE